MEYKNAITFIEAMVGWEDVAEQQSKPLSPHCVTHLKAVLGNDALSYIDTHSPKPGGNVERLASIADYLIEVGWTIKREIRGKGDLSENQQRKM